MKSYLILFFWFTSLSLTFAESTTTLGRYVGFLSHPDIKRDQLARLDLITSRESNNTLEIVAVLNLFFGDFKSHEYVSFQYDKVSYNILNGTLIFDETSKPLKIIVDKFSPDELVARVISDFGGSPLSLKLRKDGKVTPSHPLIAPIQGDYSGTCKNPLKGFMEPARFMLYTYRSDIDKEGSTPQNLLFRANRVVGMKAVRTPDFGWLSLTRFNSGIYQFFNQELLLETDFGVLACKVVDTGLQCDKCSFLKRTSPEMTAPFVFEPPGKRIGFPSALDKKGTSVSGLIEGTYRGYVHHENLDVFQPAELEIVSYQDPENKSLILSGTARVSFGEFGAGEVLVYRFDKKKFPLLSKSFLLRQPGANVDAMLEINSITDTAIKGIWYSEIFGRVGTFILSKQGTAPLVLAPSDVKMESISGRYRYGNRDLVLRPINMGSLSPVNPFAPYQFTGRYMFNHIIFDYYKISSGSYDFYTGRFGYKTNFIILGDNPRGSGVDEEPFQVGWRNTQKTLSKVKMVSSTWTNPGEFAPSPVYQRIAEP